MNDVLFCLSYFFVFIGVTMFVMPPSWLYIRVISMNHELVKYWNKERVLVWYENKSVIPKIIHLMLVGAVQQGFIEAPQVPT